MHSYSFQLDFSNFLNVVKAEQDLNRPTLRAVAIARHRTSLPVLHRQHDKYFEFAIS